MALHFEPEEFEARRTQVLEEMARRKLDALLLFAPESHYWLTGYDTFGYCFFQCLVLHARGRFTLLTRSADLRQARHTSLIENIVVWTDAAGAGPAVQLRDLLNDLGLLGARHRRRIRHAWADRCERPRARRRAAELSPRSRTPPISFRRCAC